VEAVEAVEAREQPAVLPARDPATRVALDAAHTEGIHLAALTVWALARRRRVTGTTPAWAWRTSLAEVGIVYGTVPWVWMTMLPGSGAGADPTRVSLVPLRDLLTILADGPVTATRQVVGNRVYVPTREHSRTSMPPNLRGGVLEGLGLGGGVAEADLPRVARVGDFRLAGG
jgi:hypothetical protein